MAIFFTNQTLDMVKSINQIFHKIKCTRYILSLY